MSRITRREFAGRSSERYCENFVSYNQDYLTHFPLHTVGRAGDVAPSSRTAITLAEMVRVWREIASHRLMGSMVPLPAISDTHDRPKQPKVELVSGTVDLSVSEQDQVQALGGSSSEHASALSTYRYHINLVTCRKSFHLAVKLPDICLHRTPH
jgi:hypothetical protein